MFQMLSHGVVSAALFLCVGVLYDRMHTREIAVFGGLVHRMPRYAFVFMFFTLASIGLPGLSGFVGEFLVLLGAFKVNTWVAFLAATGLILGAAYALWLYRKIIFGELTKDSLKAILDMNRREVVVFLPLVLLTLWMGVYPNSFLDPMAPAVDKLVGDYRRPSSSRAPRRWRRERPGDTMILGLESWTLARPELFLAAVDGAAADLRRGPRRSGDAVRVGRDLAGAAGDGGAAVRALSRGHRLRLAVHRRPPDHDHEGAGAGRLGHRHPDVARLFRAGQGLALRVSAAGGAGHARHDADDLGQRPDGALCRPRAAVAGALRRRRLPARQRCARPRPA